MNHRYLEITFRNGKPLAAYLYLHRQPGDTCARTETLAGGMIVDYAVDGRPIGIEITAPARVTFDAVNQALAQVHQAPATRDELAPLHAA